MISGGVEVFDELVDVGVTVVFFVDCIGLEVQFLVVRIVFGGDDS